VSSLIKNNPYICKKKEMAQIPLDEKFVGLSASTPTFEKRSALINSESQTYTMQDIVDTVSTAVSSNPQVIDLKVTNGTAVTGTTVNTISQTLLIPANTFTSAGGMLEFMARFQKTGTAGNQSCSVYLNTTPVINVNASLVAAFSLLSTNGFVQGIRTARINSNTLTVFTIFSAAANDYSLVNNVQQSVAFNVAVDNYLIFTIQLGNSADSSVVEMARAVKYE
jgi:hypothetical protein